MMGAETFEEADDFDVNDDMDPMSPYEEQFDPFGYEPGAFKSAVQRGREAAPAPQASSSPPEPAPVPATTPDPPATPSHNSPGGGPEGGGSPKTPPPAGPVPGRFFRNR